MTNSQPRNPRKTRPQRIRTLAIGVLLGLLASVFAATSASAVVATGHAVGFESQSGYWIGSYRMADGGSGFCVNLGRTAPTGNDFEFVDAATLGWYSDDDRARLAYISRTWASTSDPVVAASAQLATWMITGLDGRAPAELAARAGVHAAEVLAGANGMIAKTNGQDGASRSVTAKTIIDRSNDGTDKVRVDLDIDYLAGGIRAPRGSQHGTIKLSGAVFDDGSAQRQVTNGTRYSITPTTDGAVSRIVAEAAFPQLPLGNNVTIGRNPGDVQNLLIASAASASAVDRLVIDRPTAKRFQPTVATQTSQATATAGASITDKLTVGLAPAQGTSAPGTSAEWGVYGPNGGPYLPVPVTVRSSLLGPFNAQPAEADAPPADAPVVCSVQTLIKTGPGDYETAPCTLAGPGYYVWVESIEATDTPADAGQVHVIPWHSRFAVATEVTVVPAPVPAPVSAVPVETAPIRYLAETGSSIEPQAVGVAAALILLGATVFGFTRRRTRSLTASRSARS